MRADSDEPFFGASFRVTCRPAKLIVVIHTSILNVQLLEFFFLNYLLLVLMEQKKKKFLQG